MDTTLPDLKTVLLAFAVLGLGLVIIGIVFGLVDWIPNSLSAMSKKFIGW